MSKCFMLTAGLGTRLRPFTEHNPKPTLPMLNIPLMGFGYYLARQAGFDDFIFNKHHCPDVLESSVKSMMGSELNYHISDETNKILGSGGAIWKAKELLKNDDWFLIANGDELLIPKSDEVIKSLVNTHLSRDALCTLLTCNHKDLMKSLKPVWVDKLRVRGFGMTPPSATATPVHYTGYKIFSKRIFDYLPDGESNIFYDVVSKAISQGETVAYHHLSDAAWYETGNFEDFKKAAVLLAAKHSDYLERVAEFLERPIKIHKKGHNILVAPKKSKVDMIAWLGINSIGENVDFEGKLILENTFVGDDLNLQANPIFQETICQRS